MLAIAPLLALALQAPLPEPPPQTFRSICYHEVRDKVVDADPFAVTTAELVEQFEWLGAHGYHPVSVDDLVAAREGRRFLPEKAVLLTFDDARKSVIERVLPILKMYRYPAVVSVVGSWIEGVDDARAAYSEENLLPLEFANWHDLHELVDSGLVEIASHSYASHEFVAANPQRGMQPALVTRRYDPGTKTYESEERYRARVRADLERNSKLLEANLGVRPRVVTWPYGLSNGVLEDTARDLGMTISLSLEWGLNDARDMRGVHRYAVGAHTKIESFAWAQRWNGARDATRVLFVDPAALTRGESLEPEFDRLIERVKDLGITTVCLKAFVEDPATGRARSTYFPNRHLPIEADIFSHVAQRLNSKASVEVFAWMPVVGFALPDLVPASTLGAQRVIREIYEDLARHASFQGIYLQDVRPTDDSEPARLEWTDQLIARVRDLRDTHVATARGVWFTTPPGRDDANTTRGLLAPYDAHFDWIALALDGGRPWSADELVALAHDVRALPPQHARALVLLPARGGDRDEATDALVRDMQLLQREGAPNFGTGPGQDLGGLDLDRLRPAVSVEDFPYRRP